VTGIGPGEPRSEVHSCRNIPISLIDRVLSVNAWLRQLSCPQEPNVVIRGGDATLYQ
jgi:hypothetical protein